MSSGAEKVLFPGEVSCVILFDKQIKFLEGVVV